LQNDSETDVPEKTNAMIGFNYSWTLYTVLIITINNILFD
jgi:hypothetical protein